MEGIEIPWGALAWLAVPLLLMGLTSFTKISVVLSALRTGLGAEALIPGAALYTLGVLLAALTMVPTAMECYTVATSELQNGLNSGLEVFVAVAHPLLEFAERNSDPNEVSYVTGLAGRAADDPLVLALSFMLTELTEAFRAVVFLLIPFILVDLLIGQLLTFTGVQVSMHTLALPLKLLLFIAVDGWHLVITALVQAYQP